jgi:hypothetical protein
VLDPKTGISPGDTLYVVWYAVPVQGDFDLFGRILRGYAQSSRFYTDGGKVWIKAESKTPLIGDAVRLAQIKAAADARLDQVEQRLVEFENAAKPFNNVELPSLVASLLAAEQNKRAAHKAALVLLQPSP